MNRERAIYLIKQYCSRQLNATELTELEALLYEEDEEKLVDYFHLLAEEEAATPFPATLEMIRPSVNKVLEIDRSIVKPMPFIRRWTWIAASVLILAIAGTYFWWSGINNSDPLQPAGIADIGPAQQGAVLTLADGRSIILDSMQQGLVATQGKSKVLLQNGALHYENIDSATTTVTWNTMTIPPGRQFRLELPDGTKVYLNAASSIRYPTSFNAQERKVEVKGEAYFDVSSDSRAPFIVSTGHQTMIQVLGTAFNIKSYEEDMFANTTLIEGSVRVLTQDPSATLTLKPGQQAQSNNQALRLVPNVSVSQVIAWKNGLFNFNNTTLKEAMPQIARWYNLEVVYEKDVKDIELYGKINRLVNLSDMITLLEGAGVHFRLEGKRKLIVSN